MGVRVLKNGLSRYLAEVKQGQALSVTERGAVIAELRGVSSDPTYNNPVIESWISDGTVEPPLRKDRVKVGRSSVTLPKGTAQKLLVQDRGE